MSTVTHPTPTAPAGVTPTRVLVAEWVKFRTLRSSWITLLGAVATMIVVGLVVGYTTSTSDWSTLEAENTAASAPLQGYFLAQLLIGVLGVLFVTGEYGTGMIRSTFAAVPRRLSVVGAKAAVFGVVALVTMAATSFGAFFAAQPFLAGDGHGASLADPGALRAVVGAGVYLALVGVLGGAFGWIVRSTAGGISALVGLLLIVPVMVQLLPESISETIAKALPGSAGQAFASSVQLPGQLGPWTGLAVLVGWVLVALGVAAVLVRRRDA